MIVDELLARVTERASARADDHSGGELDARRDELERVLDAFRRGNADEAAAAMERHLDAEARRFGGPAPSAD